MISGCGNKKSSNTNYESQISPSDIFTDRDLEQEVDTSDATTYNVEDGNNITISEDGEDKLQVYFKM